MELEDIKEKHYIKKFEVKTIKGDGLIFGDGSDKPTLLVLFTTWCSSCMEAAPAISNKFSHLKEQINLVGIGPQLENTGAEPPGSTSTWKLWVTLVPPSLTATVNS